MRKAVFLNIKRGSSGSSYVSMKSNTVSRSQDTIDGCFEGFFSLNDLSKESKLVPLRSTSKIAAIGFKQDLYEAIVDGERFLDWKHRMKKSMKTFAVMFSKLFYGMKEIKFLKMDSYCLIEDFLMSEQRYCAALSENICE